MLTDLGSGTILGQATGVVITGSWTASGDDYWRASDQGEIKSHVSFLVSGQASGYGNTAPFSVTLIMDSQNLPPENGLQFPLYVGEHWSETTTNISNQTTYGSNIEPTSETNTTTTTRSLDVVSSQVLAVDAGSFDTYLIRASSPHASSDNYYSPEVETYVKSVTYNSTGYPVSTLTLSNYNAWPFKSSVNISANGQTYGSTIGADVDTYNVVTDTRSWSFQV